MKVLKERMHTSNLIIQYRDHFRHIKYKHAIHYFQFKEQCIETLIRTIRCDATAGRGARFHPTIGSVTPDGFITGHPQA
jgi:hypothetical protein